MATYCTPDCENTALCDFCVHYRDDSEGKTGFAGEGTCDRTGARVDATDLCDEFHCRLAKEGE